MESTVGTTRSHSEFKPQVIVFRRSKIDVALQFLVPITLQASIQYQPHHSVLSGHPGAHRMYYNLRRE